MLSDRRLLGWAAYDWAGSAYSTTVATTLLPAYFATVVAGDGRSPFGADVSATSLWGYAVSLAAAGTFALAPVLGAVADRAGWRKALLAACCLTGSLCAAGTALAGPGDAVWALGLFVAAQTAYGTGNACYDATLTQLAPPEGRDRASSLGYAAGYVGGGLQLALSLGLIAFHDRLGLDESSAVRLGIAGAGLWWLGFGCLSLRLMPAAPPGRAPGERLSALAAAGVRQTLHSARLALARPELRRFFLAYLFYNDAIQTVVGMAAIFGKQEIGLTDQALVLTLLAIQVVAFAGALFFGRLAAAVGTRKALAAALAIWTVLAALAREVTGPGEFLALGAAMGVALGGSQALSRSLFSRLVPAESNTVYFGFFSVLAKFSAILGPLVFALVNQATGSSRPAVLVVAAFFLIGLVLLARVPVAAHA